MIRLALILTVLIAFAVPATAQESAVVWTGGVGIDERESAPKEGTKLVFFVNTGNFLANVHVVVTDAAGHEVVNAISTGPWMILKLAPGSYRVRAEVGGQAQGGRIEVTDNSQQFAYMFKAQ